MEKPRPTLVRTYSGLRGKQGRGAGARRGGGPGPGPAGGLRRLPRPALWVSPRIDPKQLFNTSSSGEVTTSSSSPSRDDDSDFLSPRRRLREKPLRVKDVKQEERGKQGREQPKENWDPNRASDTHPKAGGGASDLWPPTPLRRNVTHRHRARRPLARGQIGQLPPLLCSTPQPPCLTPQVVERDWAGEKEGGGSVLQGSRPPSCLLCSQGSFPQEEDFYGTCDYVLSELSLLKMDGDAQEMGGSLEQFGQDSSRSRQRKYSHVDSQAGSRMQLSQLSCTPVQSHFPGQLCKNWSKTGASLGNQEQLTTHLGSSSSSPNTDDGQALSISPKSNIASLSPSRGALQLQARMCDGKIALSNPKDAIPLPAKRQQISVPLVELNGTFSEELIELDQSSPQFQPVVLLDNQVVPNWLATHSSRKQASGYCFEKKDTSQSDSPCALPGRSSTRNTSQVVPAGTTGKKSCIMGFSSSRWRQHRKLEQIRHKKNLGWKQQTNSFLQGPMEDDLPLSLSPDSTLKNSGLWRRIRASLSLHKKKKILSEAESFNSSIAGTPVKSHLAEPSKIPFTQKLGYSICPTSSMVLLSSMTSFFSPEVALTDAEKVYGECQQRGPIPFEDCISSEKMQKCEKIGEGVFGEVFRTEGEQGAVALKIIPIEGSNRVNGEPQKTFSEILPEIIISKELSLLAEEKVNQTSGFIRLYSVHCVQGAYPEPLLSAWDEYHRLRESENDRPDFFGDQQLFMVLEFEFGGTDLENMRHQQLNSVAVAKSLLQQVTASLAVAEEALRFEHRDLHWGNVLVRKTRLKDVSITLNGETRLLPTQGYLVNIIDYTFSRLERDGLTVYCDLSTDTEVFQGQGDYQFDIYRQMREENANNWAGYSPHSNVLWLHYLADKLLKEVTYKRRPKTSSMKQTEKQLKLFSEEVLGFRSATDLLNASTLFQ
ncbi:Serine/threonine-protein kinase haspin [Varanus komodoensis]|uniref:Serine/threonine-protein kinase haspin n=1 Tax=Varanus komodoensis TaxID=61221 RepID=A0A8D2L8Y1_VARKO|nr:serine/threonine-protein kinase haspin [Varanus komodoensis]KAF7244420.1 Serine/threonine-protein kinase haspin [Varanus komodoensis]